MVIAIDGHSSCGKSTVARAIADRLGIRYIDSGAMYRAVTVYFMQNNIPLPAVDGKDNPDYRPVLEKINIEFHDNLKTGVAEVYLNGQNVNEEIRSMEVSQAVSRVSSIKEIREKMVWMQQHLDRHKGIVMDGRDIGTTVFPDADLKIFMTADINIRAQRRFDELQRKGIKATMEEVVENLRMRDHDDTNREASPLRMADGAVVLDNTHLNREQQLDFIVKSLKHKGLSD